MLKWGEYVTTCDGVFLVLYWLFARNILNTYIGLKNLNNTFWLAFLNKVLDCYTKAHDPWWNETNAINLLSGDSQYSQNNGAGGQQH